MWYLLLYLAHEKNQKSIFDVDGDKTCAVENVIFWDHKNETSTNLIGCHLTSTLLRMRRNSNSYGDDDDGV